MPEPPQGSTYETSYGLDVQVYYRRANKWRLGLVVQTESSGRYLIRDKNGEYYSADIENIRKAPQSALLRNIQYSLYIALSVSYDDLAMLRNFGQPPDVGSSLYDTLRQRYLANSNYLDQNFLSVDIVEQELDYKQIKQWTQRHSLHKPSQLNNDNANLIHVILTESRLLFAMLVLGKAEHLFLTLQSHGLKDSNLFNREAFRECCCFLTRREKHDVAKYRARVGAILGCLEHDILSAGTVLPYRNVNDPKDDRGGGFGIVQKIEVAAGHLKGYNEKTVALKKINFLNNSSREQMTKAYREVETLQKRRHQNIVPLLASYYLDGTDSSNNSTRTMHLLFPWAEMDLFTWMTCSMVPAPLQGLSRHGRQTYIYDSMYALLSALSYLHEEKDGLITSHHDLKPKNILVIGQDFKIADLGRSHLLHAGEGSKTSGILGTHEYRPPEYYRENGGKARIKHGRAFDMWAMGCILMELAILIVYDWKLGKVSEFRKERAENTALDCPQVAKNQEHDNSFHNNWSIVEKWFTKLAQYARDRKELRNVLAAVKHMLVRKPGSRLYSWEAEADLQSLRGFGRSQVVPRNDETSSLRSPHEEHLGNGVQTPLHRAALKEDGERMTALLSLGWHIHAQDGQGCTTLDIVKRSANSSFRGTFDSYLGQVTLASDASQESGLLQAVKRGDSATMKTLLREGVNLLQADSEGCSALILAVTQGNISAIEELLKSKAEEQLLLKDLSGGNTALHQAVLTDRQEIVKKLLEYSPDPEDRQCEGKTALFLAVEKELNGTVQILLSNSPSARLFTQCNAGNTPIHKAVNLNNDILRMLLHGKDAARCLKHKNQRGETPIWLAVRHESLENFHILRGSGASLRVTNNDHENLWHLMAQQNNVEFLAKTAYAYHTSDLRSCNRWNDTPLTVAERRGHSDIAALMWRYSNGSSIASLHKSLKPNEAFLKSSKLFYALVHGQKWIKEDLEGYWRHLTYDSYQIYERIYMASGEREKQSLAYIDFVTQFEPNDPHPKTIEYVWKRLLSSPTKDVRKTSHPKPFVLAILYMLHIERFCSERPRGDKDQLGEVKAQRREILKKYDKWVCCECRSDCPNEWNFAGDVGMYRSRYKNAGKCKVVQVVEGHRKSSSIFSSKERDLQLWKSLLASWKKA